MLVQVMDDRPSQMAKALQDSRRTLVPPLQQLVGPDQDNAPAKAMELTWLHHLRGFAAKVIHVIYLGVSPRLARVRLVAYIRVMNAGQTEDDGG